MLSISTPMKGAGKGDYYLGLAREDYYTKGGEPPGQWYGEGAEALELKGQVGELDLRNLLEGYSPDGKLKLVQNAGDENRQSGWDLTFSAPKSVSTIWAVADPEMRRAIQEAHREAVHRALDYIQDEAGFTRRGKGGAITERTGLIFAEFEHGTSRAQDPQLHTHVLTLNQGVRSDGTWGTIKTKPIFENKMAAGTVYRAELAYQLEERLNLKCVRDKSCFRVDGSPRALDEEFSKRRKEIEAALKEGGFSGAVASKVAALNTRSVKDHVARESLFEEWRETGTAHGFTGSEARTLTAGARLERDRSNELTETISKGTKSLTDKESYFSRSRLIRYSAEEAQGRGLSAKEVLDGVDKFLGQSQEIIFLGEREGKRYYSTKEILELESEILSTTRARREEIFPISDRTVERVLEKRPTTTDEQKDAVRHITQNNGATQVVTGLAGTGKSFMLDASREAFESEGYKVYGCAPSGVAAKGLENSAGIKSATIHRTLSQIERGELRLDDRSVLIVDEAGMVSTKLMHRLVVETDKSKAKLILVGDERQLQSVEAGGALKALKEDLGYSELTQITRQRETWAKEAVRNFADGNAERALKTYAERGFVTVTENTESARDALIAEWRKEGVKNPERSIIIASTNLDVSILNEKAQAIRFSEGELKGDFLKLQSGHVFAGDRIVFTRNSTKLGVNNGDFASVTDVNAGTRILKAKLDSGKEVRIELRSYDHVKLSYAVTNHKGQGSTFENAHLFVNGIENRESAYVKASRVKGNAHFYMDSVTAGKGLTDITRQMERSQMKEFAHSFVKNQSLKQSITHAR